jgi:exopolyphosphatase/guanosine-5'-triphosphate,3'-diphosphate pyrophosphatase
LGLTEYDGRQVDGLRVPIGRLREIIVNLGRLSVAERTQLAGLDPRRADVIFAGAMILLRAAERAAVSEVVVSDRGVRWGVLEELADEKSRTNGGGQG